jgi:ubiquitin C-terminal hydrolase
LRLPTPAASLQDVVFESKEQRDSMQNLDYGLYAVVIHTGSKLDGGHYFT